MILFNRRREGEVSKVKLETFIKKPNYSEGETDIIREMLSTSEKLLYKNYEYVSIKGKRGRKVPLLYSKSTKEAVDALIKFRNDAKINKNNIYKFANSKDGFIRGNDALQKCISKCDLKHPELIKSTNMRKHVATVAQVMNLNNNDIELLSNHLGHSLNVHHKYYRLHESTLETTKVVKLLSLVNSGNISKYKNKEMEDIQLEDIINEEIEQGSNEVNEETEYEVDNPDEVQIPTNLDYNTDIELNELTNIFKAQSSEIVRRKR